MGYGGRRSEIILMPGPLLDKNCQYWPFWVRPFTYRYYNDDVQHAPRLFDSLGERIVICFANERLGSLWPFLLPSIFRMKTH